MKRILIVEDDPGIAMALEDDLSAQGYGVRVVTTGTAGIEAAAQKDVDLVLLDVMLPGADGFEVCRTLRRRGIGVPVILLTARAQEHEKLRGFECGADDYVTKPYSPRELRARIDAVLRRAGNPGADVWISGDLEVDFRRRELRRGGRVVALTPLEFKLLTVFVQHRGAALSRQGLIDAAWGVDTFVTDRVVDNQVTNLRKKIEPDLTAPSRIVSIRGFGYRFDG